LFLHLAQLLHLQQLLDRFTRLGKLLDLESRRNQKVLKLPRSFSISPVTSYETRCDIFYEMHDMTL